MIGFRNHAHAARVRAPRRRLLDSAASRLWLFEAEGEAKQRVRGCEGRTAILKSPPWFEGYSDTKQFSPEERPGSGLGLGLGWGWKGRVWEGL